MAVQQRSIQTLRPHNLPRQLTPFIGREEELAEIGRLLSDPACWLLTLVGPGGIGKTRLAIEAATTRLPDFANGVFFVNLQPVCSIDLLVSAVAGALSLPLSGPEEPLAQLFNYLCDKEMLLVLDNFEHLLAPSLSPAEGGIQGGSFSEEVAPGGADVATRLLHAAPKVKLLITSREALSLQEEWLYPVGSLPFPLSDESSDWAAYSAVQLFNDRARRVRPSFSLADEEEGVVRICQLVEGMPLAIELAAPWTKTLKCTTIADEIQRNLDFLGTRLRNVPERHRSMKAALDYSWQYLTRKEQAVFKRLSVFQGGFRRAAAEQVAGATLPILTALVDKSLLRWEPSGRYQIHELLRQYAQGQLERSPEEAERARDLHCGFYTDFLHRCTQDLHGGRQREVTREIRADIENVRLAWRRAAEKARVDAIQRSVASLQFFYDVQGYYLENATVLETAAQSLDQLAPDMQTTLTLARVLVQLGWSHIRLGQLEKAKAVLGRSWAVYNELDTQPPPGFATHPLVALGVLANIYGNYAEATRLAEEASRLNEKQADNHNLQLAFYVLANAALAQGKIEAAHDYARRAYAVVQETGNRWFMAYVLSDLGNVARALGNYAEAREYYQTSYTIRKEFNDPEGMAAALNHLAKIAWLQKDYREAELLYQQSLAIYREINDRGGLAMSLNGLGDTARDLDDVQGACQYFCQALQITVDMQFTPLTLEILTGIGELLLQTGQPEQGSELLASVLHHPAGDQETKGRARQCLARIGANLAPEVLAAAVERGQTGDLDTTAAALLAELKTIEKQADVTSPPTGSRVTQQDQPLIDPLTARELEVLRLIVDGLTNREIAEKLSVVIGTVKAHNNSIYGKLGVGNRVQALARARELNLL